MSFVGLVQKQSTPLSFENISSMLPKDSTNLLMYQQLSYISSEQLLAKPTIILMQIERRNAPKVGHFIAILDYPEYVEHFDSYGLNIEEEVRITNETGILLSLLKQAKKKIVSNHYRFQQFREDVETCGRWCVVRILLKQLALPQFKSFILAPVTSNDNKVVLLTYFLGNK